MAVALWADFFQVVSSLPPAHLEAWDSTTELVFCDFFFFFVSFLDA